MFSIGEFARHGRVSVRMLRHYDAIGLLQPAKVDRTSGYRFYAAHQLAQLNRVIALKDLGFTLQQVQVILDDQVSGAELRGMLRLRQSELQTQIADHSARLARVEARLQTIESEGIMPTDEVVIKTLPAIRVAELTGSAGGFEPQEISPVIQPLYAELCARLERAGIAIVGPAIAYYDEVPDGSVVVHAAVPVAAEPSGDHDFAIVDLPEVRSAATILHRGSMDNVLPAWQSLAKWIEANGYRSAGAAREHYIALAENPDEWVTELQEPVTAG